MLGQDFKHLVSLVAVFTPFSSQGNICFLAAKCSTNYILQLVSNFVLLSGGEQVTFSGLLGKKYLKQTETKLNVKHILVWSWPYGCNSQKLQINLYIMKKLFLLYNENIEKLQVPRAQGAVFTLPVCLTKHTKQDIQFTVTTEQYYKSSHSFKMLTSDYVWHFHFYLIFDQLTN